MKLKSFLVVLALSLITASLFSVNSGAEIIEGMSGSSIVSVSVTPDGKILSASSGSEYATKITEIDASIYVGVAAVGSAQASAVWQAKKILTSGSDTIITWADGNTNFDNVATDLGSLTYQ